MNMNELVLNTRPTIIVSYWKAISQGEGIPHGFLLCQFSSEAKHASETRVGKEIQKIKQTLSRHWDTVGSTWVNRNQDMENEWFP